MASIPQNMDQLRDYLIAYTKLKNVMNETNAKLKEMRKQKTELEYGVIECLKAHNMTSIKIGEDQMFEVTSEQRKKALGQEKLLNLVREHFNLQDTHISEVQARIKNFQETNRENVTKLVAYHKQYKPY